MLTAGEALRGEARKQYIRDAIVAGIVDCGKRPPLIVQAVGHRRRTRYREIGEAAATPTSSR